MGTHPISFARFTRRSRFLQRIDPGPAPHRSASAGLLTRRGPATVGCPRPPRAYLLHTSPSPADSDKNRPQTLQRPYAFHPPLFSHPAHRHACFFFLSSFSFFFLFTNTFMILPGNAFAFDS